MARATMTPVNENYAFTLSLNLKLPCFAVNNMKSGSIQLKFDGAVTGTFALGASNSGDDSDFNEIYNSELDATDETSLMWNLRSINYKFVRVQYTGASTTTGTMYSRFRRELDHV